jgi:hypothetical protein
MRKYWDNPLPCWRRFKQKKKKTVEYLEISMGGGPDPRSLGTLFPPGSGVRNNYLRGDKMCFKLFVCNCNRYQTKSA